jgi:hypothetical protein
VLTVLTVVEEPVYTRDGLSGWQALKKKPQHVTARYVTIIQQASRKDTKNLMEMWVASPKLSWSHPCSHRNTKQNAIRPPRIAQLETPTWPPCEAISTPVSWNALECWSTRHMIGGLYFHVKLHLVGKKQRTVKTCASHQSQAKRGDHIFSSIPSIASGSSQADQEYLWTSLRFDGAKGCGGRGRIWQLESARLYPSVKPLRFPFQQALHHLSFTCNSKRMHIPYTTRVLTAAVAN